MASTGLMGIVKDGAKKQIWKDGYRDGSACGTAVVAGRHRTTSGQSRGSEASIGSFVGNFGVFRREGLQELFDKVNFSFPITAIVGGIRTL